MIRVQCYTEFQRMVHYFQPRREVDFPPTVDCLSPARVHTVKMNFTQTIATSTTTMESQELPTTEMSSTKNPHSNATERSTIQSTIPAITANRSTFIGPVIAGTVVVVVVIIVIAAVIVWRRKNGRCSLKMKGKQLNEQLAVNTLPKTKQRPIPSPRPDIAKTVHVTVSNLSTSNLYEDVDGQNTRSELSRNPYTNEGNYYLELIGPDEPEYAQTNKTKVTEKQGDSNTYQNVDNDDKNTTKPDYYNLEVINKVKQSSFI